MIAVGSPEALSSKVVTMALARGFLRLKLVPGLVHALRVTDATVRWGEFRLTEQGIAVSAKQESKRRVSETLVAAVVRWRLLWPDAPSSRRK